MGAERHRQRSEEWADEAWRLRVQGWTQARVAEHLGVSQQRVSQILVKVEKRLHAEFVTQAEEIKARQTLQLEAVYDQAMEQWRRSCEDAERAQAIVGRVKVLNDGTLISLPDLQTLTSEGQSGNPALLEKAMAALAAVRAIWGLEAPKKQELSAPGGGPVIVREVRVHLEPKPDE